MANAANRDLNRLPNLIVSALPMKGFLYIDTLVMRGTFRMSVV
jgi:hypothetical protein